MSQSALVPQWPTKTVELSGVSTGTFHASELVTMPKQSKAKSDTQFSKTLQAFALYVNIGRFLQFCPYRFDGDKRNLIFYKSRKYQLGILVAAALVFMYDVFLVQQCARLEFSAKYGSEVPPGHKIRTFYITTLMLTWSSGVPVALYQFGSYAAIFNGLMAAHEQINKEHPYLKRGSRAMKWVFRGIIVMFIFSLTVFPRDLLRAPDMPLLISSVLDLGKWRKLLVVPFWALHTYIRFAVFYYSYLTTMLLLLFVSTVTPAVELLRPSKIRDPETIRQIFEKLAIIDRVYTSILGPWTLQLVVTHVVYMIICCYQWFLFRSPFTGICAPVIFAILVSFTAKCGKLYESSAEVMKSWAVLENDVAFCKWRRSRRPLRVTIGSFFHFDRGVMLTFMEIIVTNSATLILSSR